MEVPTVIPGVSVHDAQFPNAPKTSLDFVGRYEWPVIGGFVGAQLDGRWNDDQFLEGTNSDVSHEPAYSVWNASLSYRTGDDHVRLSAYVKNFTDVQYRIYELDLGQLGFTEQVFAPPRTIGGNITYRW
jgi:iron complex outermembrane receptor protein